MDGGSESTPELEDVLRDVLSWSFPIGQLFGIAIRVHFVLPIVVLGLVGRVAVTKGFPTGAWQDMAIFLGLMFFAILLHELGHCFAARYMDGEADEVLLWPLGGLAFCRSLPHTPLPHFVVALGGPLVNVVLCLITGAALMFGFDFLPPFNPFAPFLRAQDNVMATPLSGWHSNAEFTENIGVILLAQFYRVNWILLLFNMALVGHPFDAGRMLQAALWPRFGHYQSSKIAVYAGFVVMVIVGLCAIIYSEPLLAFLTIFIFMSCAQELQILESAHEDSLFGYDFSQGYTSLEKDDEPPKPKPKKQNFIQRWLAERAAKKEQMEREQREAEDKRMDELLEKIQKYGKDSLTDEEQRFLKRVSDRYKKQ